MGFIVFIVFYGLFVGGVLLVIRNNDGPDDPDGMA